MIRLRLRITLSAGREKSTSMPSPSRLKSSSTFNSRNARPSIARQCMFTCMRGAETIRHEIPSQRMRAFACRAVHRPRHVRRVRHSQCIGLVPLQAFARLNAQIQLQFAVDAPLGRLLCNRLSANGIDAFVVPLMALHIAQMQET
jgi:hypothetical protein